MTGFLGTLMNRLFAARKKGITVNVDDGVGEERSLAEWTSTFLEGMYLPESSLPT